MFSITFSTLNNSRLLFLTSILLFDTEIGKLSKTFDGNLPL